MVDEFRHAFAEIEGVRLHWTEFGATRPAGSPPVVLLHGLTDSHLTWRSVVSELARDRLVLMPDRPGCGLSERPNASYELSWQAEMIAKWLQWLGLHNVDVVGHSYGGGVAQMLLLCRPARVRRIVLVASGGLGRDVGLLLKLAAFPRVVERFGQPFMAFGTRQVLGRVRHAEAQQQALALSLMNAEMGTARAFARTVADVIDWRGQRRLFFHRAHEVRTFPPMAVLWGERDALIPMAHGVAFSEAMDGVVFKSFAGGGHYVHQECASEVVCALREFLDDPHAQPVRLRTPSTPGASKLPRLRLRHTLAALTRTLVRR